MASQTSKNEPKATSFREFAADLAHRREALGEINMPRNNGKRRTESKKALLKAIRNTGGKW